MYAADTKMGGVVSIVRGEEPDKMLKEALDLLGGLENIVSGDSALLKPNLGSWVPEIVPEYVNLWATTKPEIVEALINELRNVGIMDVSVAEGAPLSLDATAQFEDSGMRELVESFGGKVIDLDRGDHIRVKIAENLHVEVGKSIIDTDNLINLPVMKTHVLTGLTLGLKNLKGTISKTSRRMMHRGNLEKSIALLCKVMRPKLTIVDGLVGMEGFGPAIFGKPIKPGLLIAGTDPVSVDAVTATIMGHDPKEIDHIRIAWELGLGEIELDKIEIRGISLDEARHPFEPAQPGHQNQVNMLGIEGIRYYGWTPGDIGSECSGCINTILNGLAAFHDDVSTIQRPLDIVIGQKNIPDEIGDNVLLYGDCQARNKNGGIWLPGCPPSIKDTYTSIGKMSLSGIPYIWALMKRLIKGNKVKPLPHWKLYNTQIH